nr:4'-phosphopantetheinyl transferase [uncultured bacterium]
MASAGCPVEVWYALVDERDDLALAQDAALLSHDELASAAAFRFEKNRREYVVAHALTRRLLSHVLGGDPRDWRFERDNRGKPRLQGVARAARFNLSHSLGCVACAVSPEHEVGLDVECARRSVPWDVVDAVFRPEERAALMQLDPRLRPERFFRLWTLKEAYIKACGLGLGAPLQEFGFDLADAGKPKIVIDEALLDPCSRWQFWTADLPQAHLTSLAVPCGPLPLTVECRPMQGG